MAKETIPVASSTEAVGQFWGAVKKICNDLVTLDVVTITGSIDLTLAKGNSVEALLTELTSQKAKAKVVASSNHQIDFDAVVFVKESPTPQELELIKLHMETVKSAQEMRSKAIETVGNIVGKLIP